MYTKRARGGPISFFYQDPPKLGFVDGKMEKKCMKRKGNNVGSCPFLPMTRQNTDLRMGNVKNIYLNSVKSKYSF